ncbi:MAG: hypothetical protein PHH30_02975 [Bacteroidales bacterium]|nr:hypothetical protein [Bacteroidales bacterium]MDD3860313.1 hypothetical protein [Bacteroidales bacterium]
MNKIIETTFKIGSDKELSKLICDYYGGVCEIDYSVTNEAHIIYTDTNPKQIILASLSSSSIKTQLNFVEYLKNIEPTDLQKLLMLVTTYPQYSKLIEQDNYSLTKVNNEIDFLLSETDGWIIYCHQLEKLLRITTKCNFAEAELLRKRRNAKHQDVFDKISEIRINNEKLTSFINERMILNLTYHPNYKAAFILYNYLNK